MVWEVGVGSFLGCAIKMLPFLIGMVSPQASSAAGDSSNAMLMFCMLMMYIWRDQVYHGIDPFT